MNPTLTIITIVSMKPCPNTCLKQPTKQHPRSLRKTNLAQNQHLQEPLQSRNGRQGIVASLFKGKQEAAHGTEPPRSPYYNPNIEKYAFNPTKAVQLLEEAGWKLGQDGIRVKNGKPLKLILMSTSGNKTRERIEQ